MKLYSVAEASHKISQDLNYPVTESRIRKYETEGFLTVQRTDSQYRQFTDDDLETIKLIVVLGEIGLSLEKIKQYLTDNNPSEILERAKIVERFAEFIGKHLKFKGDL